MPYTWYHSQKQISLKQSELTLTVIDRINHSDAGRLHLLPSDQIIFCTLGVGQKMVEFHTPDNVYYLKTELIEMYTILTEAGFLQVDRGNIVNPYRLTHVDKGNLKAYFDGDITGKYAALFASALKTIRKNRLPVTYIG